MGLAALDPSYEHGAGGGTRTPTGLPPTDFRTSYGFRRPCYAQARFAGFVVWTIPSPCPGIEPGVRCCPSSLYTFPLPGLARDCRREVSPSLGSSASAVSRGALNTSSPLRLPFRHARVAGKAIPMARGVAKTAFAANTRRVCSDFGPCSCRVSADLAPSLARVRGELAAGSPRAFGELGSNCPARGNAGFKSAGADSPR
jgi:hypothetical protein